MRSWLRQHVLALRHALRHLTRRGNGFLLNILVVAIALALPFAGLSILNNVQPLANQISVDPEISLFLRLDTTREDAIALAVPIRQAINAAGSTGKLVFVAREKSLVNLKDKTGLSDILATLGSNPLPDSYLLTLSAYDSAGDAGRIDALAAALKALPQVELVQVDSAWVKRLAALLYVLRQALLLIAMTLAVVVMAVVFNTIRLQVLNQREEIDVARLVGATDAYIARPFYYAGVLLGGGAGLLALGAVAAGMTLLNHSIVEFAQLYGSSFRLLPLPIGYSALLLCLSAGLGLIGALLSVRRQLGR
jgi:cell division transport system permease protein